ncbi:DUF2267 domain-containing protein [Micromonospora sp. NPDC092111]|uniref:DUF2267 domain-containing protein n=1 Tax=Micromonospora sp. NPDC092111 TaxID=3364289 RepID=UPI0037F88673
MRFPIFVDAVARRAELPSERAAAIARAVLVTLAERADAGESGDPATQLPDEVGSYLTGPPPGEGGPGGADPASSDRPGESGPAGFGPVEFLRRVAERAGVEPATAQAGVRAVFATLRDAVTVGEFQDLLAQLPKSFGPDIDPPPRGPYDG